MVPLFPHNRSKGEISLIVAGIEHVGNRSLQRSNRRREVRETSSRFADGGTSETLSPIRILVAGSCLMDRALLSEYLNQQGDLTVVGSAKSVEDASFVAADSSPDVLVIHRFANFEEPLATRHTPAPLRLPTLFLCASCAEELQWNRSRSRKSPVAVGACRPPDSILRAVRALHRGEREPVPVVAHAECALDTFRRAGGLTKAEFVVFSAIAGGLTNRAAAKRLGVSIRTVENHRLRLRRKLGARDTAALIKEAARVGLVARRLSIRPASLLSGKNE